MANDEVGHPSGGSHGADADPKQGERGDSLPRPDYGDGIHRGIAPDDYDVPTHIKPVRPWPKPGQSKDDDIHRS